MKIAKVNTGAKTHVATEMITEDGRQHVTVTCGSTSHFRAQRVYQTGLEVKAENITCKKCLKAFLAGELKDKDFSKPKQEEKPLEEMSIKEYVEKFGKSFTVTKEEMGRK